MPLVRITHVKDTWSGEQKATVLQHVLDAVVAVEGEALRTGIGIVLDESVTEPRGMVNCRVFVTLIVIRNALTAEQRQQMLHGVIEAIVAIEGEANRMAVWAVLEESVTEGEWSIGGNKLTLDALKQIKQGENPWEA